MPPARRLLGLAGWLLLCFAAAWIGGQFAPDTWYLQLQKPSWNPPGWVFAPVWTALYTLMAVAAWLVWREGGFRAAAGALTLFLLQLAFNAMWSMVFFGLHRPGWAVVDIGLLWLTLAATLVAFGRRRRLAAVLLAPYLAWVTFAAVLNVAIWRMNL